MTNPLFPDQACPLLRVLRRPLADTPHTRLYQGLIDDWIDRSRPSWDLDRGVIRAAKPLTGREASGPLAAAAFAWQSSLSRHKGDPALLRFFAAGLETLTDSIRDDGLMGLYGLNGQGWAHGWDIEGLIYGLAYCGDSLDPALLLKVRDRFRLSAARHANLANHPGHGTTGGIGNQRCVWTLGLHLYGQLLGDPNLMALSDRSLNNVLPFVLDASGQVIEQIGPCMHYSHTTLFYAWLNLAIRDNLDERARLAKCLEWFRCRHTENLTPLAGPSTRQYYETLPPAATDLIAPAWFCAGHDPRPLRFAERLTDELLRRQATPYVIGHGGSPWIWALLMASRPAEIASEPAAREPAVWLECRSSELIKRNPIAYYLIRQAYQTHFTLTDFLPFSGIQTWALGDEPPIIHPTPLAPSTTQGDRLDTARQGVSHNWGLYGAGALAPDCYASAVRSGPWPRFLVARYDWLWRLVFFTPRSTVILEFGNGGPRRTLWTLNRSEPAEPAFGRGIVRFQGRRGCLHSTVARKPKLVTLQDDDPWAKRMTQLEYACGSKPAAFALSDESFRFLTKVADLAAPRDASPCPLRAEPLRETGPATGFLMRFKDGDGAYEVRLDPNFFLPNPGNFRFDVFHLTQNTVFARLPENTPA